jgi:hypothetical protein
MRLRGIFLLLIAQLTFSGVLLAQADDPRTSTATCNFDDGMEVTVRYNPIVKDEPHNGRVWAPGGVPITLFTQAPLTLNNSPVPVGAYSIYVIPNKSNWTLIVSKNVAAGATYDDKDDVARSQMDLGEVETPPKQLKVSLAHSGAKQCSIRLYYGKVGAFADFIEQ